MTWSSGTKQPPWNPHLQSHGVAANIALSSVNGTSAKDTRFDPK